MTVEEAREIYMSFPDAVEGAHQGHPDFRVGGRIFATLWPDKGRAVLRLPMEMAASLAHEKPKQYAVKGRSGSWAWLGVELDRAAVEEFRDLTESAFHMRKAS